MTKIITMTTVLILLIALEHLFFVLHMKKELLLFHAHSSHSFVELVKKELLTVALPGQDPTKNVSDLEHKIHQYHKEQCTEYERHVNESIRTNIFRDLVILIIFMSILLSLTYHALKPINTLTKAISEINTGNFDYDWSIQTTDELAFMSESINIMRRNLKRIALSRQELNKEIAERKKIEQILIEEKHNLEVFQKAAVDQEMHIIKLKKTINNFMTKKGLTPKYRMSENIEL
ncbi:MAG: HAMP domain-containing protein [Candidatus Omnitrophica bacterium]|nr:HAMP domain-containing protein [Candidatus Omnitrophota bacterium]